MTDTVKTKFEAVCIVLDAAEKAGKEVSFTFTNKEEKIVEVEWGVLKKVIVDSILSALSGHEAFTEVVEMINSRED